MTNLTMEMLQEQINELRNDVKMLKENTKGRVVPAGLKVGDTFELVGLEWKILDITQEGYRCHAERLENDMQFDSSCNNWQESDLRSYLNTEFREQLEDAVGKDNIIPFKRDLLSMDGQTEYGTCEDKVSLLTVDEYRKYRALIPNTSDYWWWTITPDSTKCNDDTRWVRVVSPSGDVRNYFCDDNLGVRPFCIFSSAIFESEE